MRRTLFESEHVDFRESVRRFVAEEISPNHVEWEREGIVPRELFHHAHWGGVGAIWIGHHISWIGPGCRRPGSSCLRTAATSGSIA